MITIRRAKDRGHADWGWLDTWHSFSFGDFHDPENVHFRSLRVLNDDTVSGGGGFPTHGHRDMEILTWVLSGALEHRDSMGTGSVLRPGQLQFMRAGTGVEHSEFNHSKSDPLHFLQIWIIPDRRGLPPAYADRTPDPAALAGDFVTVASADGREGSIVLSQDAALSITRVGAGDARHRSVAAGRHAYLHVATGSVRVAAPGLPGGGEALAAGDALAITGPETFEITGTGDAPGGTPAELLLFDLG